MVEVETLTPPELPLPLDAKRFEAAAAVVFELLLAVLDEATVTEVDEDVEVTVVEPLPRVVERLPDMLPRLPASRGPAIAAKRSAAIEPVTRNVRCTSPTATNAVRKTVAAVPPPPSFGASRPRFKYAPAPAMIAKAAKPHPSACDRRRGRNGLDYLGARRRAVWQRATKRI